MDSGAIAGRPPTRRTLQHRCVYNIYYTHMGRIHLYTHTCVHFGCGGLAQKFIFIIKVVNKSRYNRIEIKIPPPTLAPPYTTPHAYLLLSVWWYHTTHIIQIYCIIEVLSSILLYLGTLSSIHDFHKRRWTTGTYYYAR